MKNLFHIGPNHLKNTIDAHLRGYSNGDIGVHNLTTNDPMHGFLSMSLFDDVSADEFMPTCGHTNVVIAFPNVWDNFVGKSDDVRSVQSRLQFGGVPSPRHKCGLFKEKLIRWLPKNMIEQSTVRAFKGSDVFKSFVNSKSVIFVAPRVGVMREIPNAMDEARETMKLGVVEYCCPVCLAATYVIGHKNFDFLAYEKYLRIAMELRKRIKGKPFARRVTANYLGKFQDKYERRIFELYGKLGDESLRQDDGAEVDGINMEKFERFRSRLLGLYNGLKYVDYKVSEMHDLCYDKVLSENDYMGSGTSPKKWRLTLFGGRNTRLLGHLWHCINHRSKEDSISKEPSELHEFHLHKTRYKSVVHNKKRAHSDDLKLACHLHSSQLNAALKHSRQHAGISSVDDLTCS